MTINSFKEFKKLVKVGTFLKVTNYGLKEEKVMRVLNTNRESITLEHPISKEKYDWYIRKGSDKVHIRQIPVGLFHYIESKLYWQPEYSLKVENGVCSFLSYAQEDSPFNIYYEGMPLNQPFSEIPAGQPWLKLEIVE